MSSQHKLIAGTVVVAVLAGSGAALAAIELSNNSAPAATTAPIDPGSYGNGYGGYGFVPGRLGGRGFGGGLGPGDDDGGFDDGGVRFAGPRMLGSTLVVAASYLGLSGTALRSRLASGQTLAQVAQAEGKPVDGLVAALVTASKKALDTALGNGYLTQQQAAIVEADMAARLKAFVDNARGRGPFGGFGGRRGTGPNGSGSGSFGGATTTT
jgi:hypothetical protein